MNTKFKLITPMTPQIEESMKSKISLKNIMPNLTNKRMNYKLNPNILMKVKWTWSPKSLIKRNYKTIWFKSKLKPQFKLLFKLLLNKVNLNKVITRLYSLINNLNRPTI